MGASPELRRVADAALRTMTDAEIIADPVGAMNVAMDAVRAVIRRRKTMKETANGQRD